MNNYNRDDEDLFTRHHLNDREYDNPQPSWKNAIFILGCLIVIMFLFW